jgi:predicted Fe-Mo cluster-binding NifX family protein
MKIALVSDDEVTISQHFGRAAYYVVVAVEEGKIVGKETRAKAGHRTFAPQPHGPAPGERRGYAPGSETKHQAMADSIADCDALITGGMGWGAFEHLKTSGIEPVVTDVADIEEAALAYAGGSLPNLMDRLH